MVPGTTRERLLQLQLCHWINLSVSLIYACNSEYETATEVNSGVTSSCVRPDANGIRLTADHDVLAKQIIREAGNKQDAIEIVRPR